jgi:transmembrane sensor
VDRKEFQELLRRYRAGNATDQEVRLINKWYQEFGDGLPDWNAQQLKEIRNSIHQQILYAIDFSQPMDDQNERRNVQRWSRQFTRLAKVAAVVGVFFTFYLAHQWNILNPPGSQQKDIEEIMVEAGQGQVKQLTLADSTVLWLNGGTKIRFEKAFHKSAERKIYLDYGEVHFDVKRDTLKPFLVNSDLAIIKVLGTSFTVKAYDELPYEQISVSSGKVQVSVRQGKQVQILGADEFLRIDKKNQELDMGKKEPEQNSSWREGVTYLEQASFDELALVIKNIYGVALTAENEAIEKQRYTLTIDRKVPLDDIVEAVSAVHNNRIRKEGGQVIMF